MVEREKERKRVREGGNSSGNSSRAWVKGLFFIAGFNSNEVVSSISRRSLQNPRNICKLRFQPIRIRFLQHHCRNQSNINEKESFSVHYATHTAVCLSFCPTIIRAFQYGVVSRNRIKHFNYLAMSVQKKFVCCLFSPRRTRNRKIKMICISIVYQFQAH